MPEKIEMLEEAYHYSQRLYSGIQDTIECIGKKQYEEACSNIVLIIDGLSWLIEAISITADVQDEKIETKNVSAFLEEGVEALQNKDYRLLGELLEFELLEIVSNWTQGLTANLQHLKKTEKV